MGGLGSLSQTDNKHNERVPHPLPTPTGLSPAEALGPAPLPRQFQRLNILEHTSQTRSWDRLRLE